MSDLFAAAYFTEELNAETGLREIINRRDSRDEVVKNGFLDALVEFLAGDSSSKRPRIT